MGRVLLILLIIVAVVLVWKAFGPGTWNRNRVDSPQRQQPRAVKGPDDDEEFLWTIEKNRFKERRAREEAAREEEERMRRARKRYDSPAADPTDSTDLTGKGRRTGTGSGSGAGPAAESGPGPGPATGPADDADGDPRSGGGAERDPRG